MRIAALSQLFGKRLRGHITIIVRGNTNRVKLNAWILQSVKPRLMPGATYSIEPR